VGKFECVYDLRPVPAPRPRVTRWGTYNPPKYTEYKNAIKLLTKIKTPLLGPLKMAVIFQFQKPKSWSKTKKENAYWHTQRPDADNLLKSIKDAYNGLVFEDDAQVCIVEVKKIWGEFNNINVTIENIKKGV